MTDPCNWYRRRRTDYTRQAALLRQRANLVSNLRLVVVAAGVAAGIAAYRAYSVEMMVAAAIAAMLLFVLLAAYHAGIFERIERFTILATINGRGIDRCESRWGGFPDAGDDFVDNTHPYTSDLDMFGKNSLYQHLCCSHTFFGRGRLAGLLQKGEGDAATIRSRQEAVGELAAEIEWRQLFECFGLAPGTGNDPQRLIDWAAGTARFFRHPWMSVMVRLLPLLTGVVAAAGYGGTKSLLFAYPLLAVQIVLVAVTTRRAHRLFGIFDTFGKAIGTFGNMLEHIERHDFKGGALVTLRREIAAGGASGSALRALKQLAGTVAASEVRFAPLPWLFANVFLLWDLRCALKLDTWKAVNGVNVRRWLVCIAEFEALSSLALLWHEHPAWRFPKINELGDLALRMRGAGHPLLGREQAVVNDYDLGPPGGSVGIITGSNMSGKSTFLRTAGCNLVLALAGAPVCAQSFECRPLRLYTSMRGADDLLSHTSTFYAELLRVKMVVDAVEDTTPPLLFLLDELFRGTNSTDRHDGAVTLLRELSKPHTLGLVSTHDLDLCSLARSNELFKNYHFEERYEGGALHFDYLLKDGPSTTRNAMYLMRMVGIGVDKKGE